MESLNEQLNFNEALIQILCEPSRDLDEIEFYGNFLGLDFFASPVVRLEGLNQLFEA